MHKRMNLASLLEKAKNGDMDAFAALFEPLRRKVHAVAYRITGPDLAEDVVMDTFLHAWKALPKLRRGGALSSWLCRIAHNRSLDLLRRRSRLVTLETTGTESTPHQRDIPDLDNLPDEVSARRDDLLAIQRAMQQLSAPHRTILQLRHVDELSYAEIAAATGVSVGTVMSRLFHARRKLRDLFEADSALTPAASSAITGVTR